MSEPGDFLAGGRAADVYDLWDGTVLRRYRTDHDSEPEGRLMQALHAAGYPVPQVHRIDGRDLVMDRVDGPTMVDDVARRPWRLNAHVRTLARLQRQLGTIEPPSWLPPDERIPAGDSILHLDLHPMNVLLSRSGPVVIDWTNACRGQADFDAAMTYILAAALEPADWKEALGVRLMLRSFLRHRGPAAIDRWWTEAIDYRRADPNVTPGEAATLDALRPGR
ncbi:MAG: phosphotransferase [Actinomycetota bacterium]